MTTLKTKLCPVVTCNKVLGPVEIIMDICQECEIDVKNGYRAKFREGFNPSSYITQLIAKGREYFNQDHKWVDINRKCHGSIPPPDVDFCWYAPVSNCMMAVQESGNVCLDCSTRRLPYFPDPPSIRRKTIESSVDIIQEKIKLSPRREPKFTYDESPDPILCSKWPCCRHVTNKGDICTFCAPPIPIKEKVIPTKPVEEKDSPVREVLNSVPTWIIPPRPSVVQNLLPQPSTSLQYISARPVVKRPLPDPPTPIKPIAVIRDPVDITPSKPCVGFKPGMHGLNAPPALTGNQYCLQCKTNFTRYLDLKGEDGKFRGVLWFNIKGEPIFESFTSCKNFLCTRTGETDCCQEVEREGMVCESCVNLPVKLKEEEVKRPKPPPIELMPTVRVGRCLGEDIKHKIDVQALPGCILCLPCRRLQEVWGIYVRLCEHRQEKPVKHKRGMTMRDALKCLERYEELIRMSGLPDLIGFLRPPLPDYTGDTPVVTTVTGRPVASEIKDDGKLIYFITISGYFYDKDCRDALYDNMMHNVSRYNAMDNYYAVLVLPKDSPMCIIFVVTTDKTNYVRKNNISNCINRHKGPIEVERSLDSNHLTRLYDKYFTKNIIKEWGNKPEYLTIPKSVIQSTTLPSPPTY